MKSEKIIEILRVLSELNEEEFEIFTLVLEEVYKVGIPIIIKEIEEGKFSFYK